MKKLILFLAMLATFTAVFAPSVAVAQASGQTEQWFETPNSGSDGRMQAGLEGLTRWVFYIFYLLGAVFLGVGAFKLKAGDLGGFAKSVGGGVALFFVPRIVDLLRELGKGTGG